MKTFWFIYYLFKNTETKSEIVKKLCRLEGVQYIELKTSKIEINDLFGLLNK